ncbi:rCG62902 [Rattus norvegicus]|uniref:Nucleophosmin n=1 Tax=Rattus norvegicus TaxID=10116 RepID=Q7TP95_RAT|nr:Ab1-351 [Rattus norvegicus]EDL75990.1 rCG62902 [Rattus norvegicus]
MWYIYTMEYYSAIKNNDFMKFIGKWMELENIILSEFLAQPLRKQLYQVPVIKRFLASAMVSEFSVRSHNETSSYLADPTIPLSSEIILFLLLSRTEASTPCSSSMVSHGLDTWDKGSTEESIEVTLAVTHSIGDIEPEEATFSSRQEPQKACPYKNPFPSSHLPFSEKAKKPPSDTTPSRTSNLRRLNTYSRTVAQPANPGKEGDPTAGKRVRNSSCYRTHMRTNLHICYKYGGGLGPSPECSFVGGSISVSPHGPRLEDPEILPDYKRWTLQSHIRDEDSMDMDMSPLRPQSYLFGCELKADKDYHFKVDNDENEHRLSLGTFSLGAGAKDELHIVEAEAMNYEGSPIKVTLATLKMSVQPTVSLWGFAITPPEVLKLKCGSGPVHISGQHLVAVEEDAESEDEDEEDVKLLGMSGKRSAPRGGNKVPQKKVKLDEDDEDDKDDDDDDDDHDNFDEEETEEKVPVKKSVRDIPAKNAQKSNQNGKGLNPSTPRAPVHLFSARALTQSDETSSQRTCRPSSPISESGIQFLIETIEKPGETHSMLLFGICYVPWHLKKGNISNTQWAQQQVFPPTLPESFPYTGGQTLAGPGASPSIVAQQDHPLLHMQLGVMGQSMYSLGVVEALVGWYCCSYRVASPFSSFNPFSNSSNRDLSYFRLSRSKTQLTTNAGKDVDVEKEEHSFIAGGISNWYDLSGNQSGDSSEN